MVVDIFPSSNQPDTYTSRLVLIFISISQHVPTLDRCSRRYFRICKAACPDGSLSEEHTRYINVDELYDVLVPRFARRLPTSACARPKFGVD
jgi:hypothetical protein